MLEQESKGTPYQVLILDLHIPDLPGIEVLRKVNDANLQVKTVVLSGESELSSVAPILRLGALDYLRKPFDPQQLINSVANALSRYQLEAENRTMHREAESNAELFGFLLDASPDFVYMLDPVGNVRYTNQHLESVFDATPESVHGHSWQTLFNNHPELTTELAREFPERRTGPRATSQREFEFRSHLGSKHTLELSSIGL